MTALLAAIPPPPFSEFHLGPLTIRMYGIMIGLGVLAATWLCGRLMAERNVGDTDDAAAIAVWGVVFGVIGARLYHVVTDFQYFRDNLIEIPMVWKPGLGIPGGILFGAIAGVIVCRRRGVPVLPALSCAAPAIPLAQSIGRWGNYFNQELYGRQTTLPWGLKVDSAFQPAGAAADVLYHPTFLYESLWNLGLCLALVWVFRNVRLQPGRLFPLYMIGYGLGRLWIEALRIDPANTIGPFRVNIWMSLLLIVGGSAWFVATRNSTARWPRPATDGAVDATSADGDAADKSADDKRADDKGADSAASSAKADDNVESADAKAGDDKAGDAKVGVDKAVAAVAAEKATTAETTAAKRSSAVKKAEGAKKSAAATSTAKKSSAAKSGAKKASTKATPAKKSAATSGTKKTAAKKTGTKKTAAKKSAAKKSADE